MMFILMSLYVLIKEGRGSARGLTRAKFNTPGHRRKRGGETVGFADGSPYDSPERIGHGRTYADGTERPSAIPVTFSRPP
jgi:hypothetical protein